MEDALDDNKRTPWEQLHGVHNIPKTYVPPFMQGDLEKPVPKPEEKVDLNELDALIDLPASQMPPENAVGNHPSQG